jgi:hypothetical protein
MFTSDAKKLNSVLPFGLILTLVSGVLNTAGAVSEFDPEPGPPAAPDSLKTPEDFSNAKNYGPVKAVPKANATQPAGALSGRIVYTAAGHGWHYISSWDTDRSVNNSMVEDFGNQDQMSLYAQYCFNAGATVVPFRPIGNQTNEVIVDNPAATLTGSWSDGASNPYYGTGAVGEVKYKTSACAASETAVARFTPNIPQQGYYPVYAWVLNGTNRAIDQLYRITHTGGATEVRVNHRRVGRGWVYLGTYYFNSGTAGYVEISNQSSSPASSFAIADAIRFGNGMGTINRGGGVSGHPKEDECSRYWAQGMNGTSGDTTVYDRSTLDDGDDNVGTPPRAAAYMNDSTQGALTDRVFLSFHSNAGGGRGVLGLYNDPVHFPGTDTPNQLAWATLVAKEVNDDLVAIGTPPLELAWNNRGSNLTYTHYDSTNSANSYAFGEIRDDSINGEMDATICEVAYHDSASDAVLLRDPKARGWVARACYQATVKYFNQYGAGTLALLPEPPTNVRAVASGGSVTVSWNAPAATSVGGQAPTGYRIYQSTDGYGFGNPVNVSGAATLSQVISGLPAGQTTYFRITSTNTGGESLPSEVLAVRGTGNSAVLLVKGFDRVDRSLNPVETQGALSNFQRIRPLKSNANDYLVQHATALAAIPLTFDSASNEAVKAGQVSLGSYQSVVWECGEESTGDATFDSTEQSLVTTYLNGGGKLFTSGAEIGWDLDFSNFGKTFYQNTLKTVYVADDAGTYSCGAGSNAFAGLVSGAATFTAPTQNDTSYPPVAAAPYNADFCDTLSPNGAGAAACLVYSTGGNAAVQVNTGTYKVINMGLPFECIISSSARNTIMANAMSFFGVVPASKVADWQMY